MPVTKFIAVGPHAGKTILLAHFQFVDGVYTFNGSDLDAALIGYTLETQYSAFREDRAPEAFERYEAAVAEAALSEPPITQASIEASINDRRVAERFLLENLHPASVYGEGVAADRVLALMRVLVEEKGQIPPAFAEVIQSLEEKVVVEAAVVTKPSTVLEALMALDPANDNHWTARGIPSVDAVSAILARGVTRLEIEEAAPDLTRSTAATK